MADEYVSKVELEINGQSIIDFQAVEVGDAELAKTVKLVGQYGAIGVTPLYQITVDYVVPKSKPEFNFTALTPGTPGTLTIDKLNGIREAYVGVSTLKIGAHTMNGDKEVVRKVTFFAADKK